MSQRVAALAVLLALFVALAINGCSEKEDGPKGLTASSTATDGQAGGDGSLPYPGNAEEVDAIAGVLAAIDSGEQLPYEEDGQTFQNREGLLADEPLGYYSEYTVETPGSPDRGARRLVIGDGGEVYYTNDHYGSFEQIDPEEYR